MPPITPDPAPTPLPQLPSPDFPAFHGLSMLGGWVPVAIDVVAAAAVLAAIGWRTPRWRLVWVPACAALGAAGALAARAFVIDQGLASDPAPIRLWLWAAVCIGAVAVAVLGWHSARWWRRGVSLLAIPLSLLATLSVVNQWVGYYPTVQSAWGGLTASPLPNQIDAADLPGLRGTPPTTATLVKVRIPATASGFNHRDEYVYLPPAWFAGATPPKLPVLMMIAGEFNSPADWMRSGNIMPTIDGYAQDHAGLTPIFVFVDAGGRFDNDTECVNGPRGNSADYLTKDVRPYIISKFGSSADPANWGVAGWSMGGTCAVDLVVMHPDLFSTFVDIGGDHGPTAGTEQQTIDRLYAGEATQWAVFDPVTVMRNHGPYAGVSGRFVVTAKPAARQLDPRADNLRDSDEANAAEDLCTVATSVNITCSVHTLISHHTWQFAARAFSDALPWLVAQVSTPPPPDGPAST